MKPDLPVRDFIFPLMTVTASGEGVSMTKFHGTAFLLAEPGGFAITAGHVADGLTVGNAVGAFVDSDGKWYSWGVEEIRRHEVEDVAVLVMSPGRAWSSPLQLTNRHVTQAVRYRLWGYPSDVLYEMHTSGRALPRPDLVYSEGHVRRRLTDVPLDVVGGRAFYELSNVAGQGCSGGPITLDAPGVDPWQVVGVYVGDRYNETERLAVAYAARIEAAVTLL